MKTAKPSSRRNFLLAAGLGTAGAVAAVVTATKRRLQANAAARRARRPGAITSPSTS